VRVTAGLAESNGSLLLSLWLTSPAGWLPRTGISFSGTLRSVIEYGLPFFCSTFLTCFLPLGVFLWLAFVVWSASSFCLMPVYNCNLTCFGIFHFDCCVVCCTLLYVLCLSVCLLRSSISVFYSACSKGSFTGRFQFVSTIAMRWIIQSCYYLVHISCTASRKYPHTSLSVILLSFEVIITILVGRLEGHPVCKFYFANGCWPMESLPNWVVTANKTKIFEKRLDQYWQHLDIIFDFWAQIDRTGSRSEVSRVNVFLIYNVLLYYLQ